MKGIFITVYLCIDGIYIERYKYIDGLYLLVRHILHIFNVEMFLLNTEHELNPTVYSMADRGFLWLVSISMES